MISRRTFLQSTGVLSTLLFCGCSVNLPIKKAVRTLGGKDLPDSEYVRQIITADPSVSRTIMWQSANEQKLATVTVREKGSIQERSFSAESEAYTDDRQKLFLHTAYIDGLKADTVYEYQLRNQKETSEWYFLRTAGKGKFKALIFPDSQCNDYSVWENNVKLAAKQQPDADFFINMGDLVDNGEDHTQWDAWLSAVNVLTAQIPFAPVMGNHETYDKKWQCRFPQAYIKEFAVPANGNKEFDRCYYSFDWGEVHFVVLNTQWDELEEFRAGILNYQKEWLRNDISRTNKRWKVALFHKDVLKYAIKNRPERQAGIGEAGMYLAPILEELGFDLVLTAHLHTYRNRGHLKAFASDKSGPVYILTGVAGNIFYSGFWLDHELDKVKAPVPEKGNYLTLTYEEDHLLVESYLFNGEKFDEMRIEKR